jgi:hypothetical protein
MVENKYVRLEKIRILNGDLGNGNYLFKPFSLTTDGENIFIYDNLQAKILKLDKDLNFVKSCGRKGEGPGEFSGTGRTYPVFIRFGRDGLLYVLDRTRMRVSVFDKNLNFLKDFKSIAHAVGPLITDSQGKKHFISMGGKNYKTIGVFDEKKNLMLPLSRCEDCFKFLYSLPSFNIEKKFLRGFLLYQLLMDITKDYRLVIYYKPSSTLTVVKNHKIILKKFLWPRDALRSFKNNLNADPEGDKISFKNMFFKMFIDEDTPDAIYLHHGINHEKKTNNVYKFNLRGELLNVLFVEISNPRTFTRFELKVNNQFITVEDTNLTIYKKRSKQK